MPHAIVGSLAALIAALTSVPPVIAGPPATAIPEHSIAEEEAARLHELARRVADLDDEVHRIRGLRGANRLDERRAAAVVQLVGDVLADVDTRASLLESQLTGGYDDEFFLRSSDNRFYIEVGGQIQVRFVDNHQNNSPRDDNVAGLEIRRAKIKVKGHLIDPRLKFAAGVGSNRDGGPVPLQDAYTSYELTEDLEIRAGRFRSPLLREESVSSKRQLLVERSLIARAFNQDRTTGFQLQYQSEDLRIRAAVMDATNFILTDQSVLFAVRAVALLSGKMKMLDDFMSFPDDEPTTAVAAGLLYQKRDPDDPSDPDSSLFRWTIDYTAEFGGANLFLAFVGNHFDETGAPPLDQYGLVLQGGFFVNEQWEVYGQYVWGDADEESPELSAITLGFNRYWNRNGLKWTLDVGYGINEVDSFWSSEGAGWRTDGPGEDGQVVVRSQFQLLF